MQSRNIPGFLRGLVIFWGVILAPALLGRVLLSLGENPVGAELHAGELGHTILYLWMFVVFPHEWLLAARYGIPSPESVVVAVGQWALVSLGVAWWAQRWSAPAQVWLSLAAAIVVGLALLLILFTLGIAPSVP